MNRKKLKMFSRKRKEFERFIGDVCSDSREDKISVADQFHVPLSLVYDWARRITTAADDQEKMIESYKVQREARVRMFEKKTGINLKSFIKAEYVGNRKTLTYILRATGLSYNVIIEYMGKNKVSRRSLDEVTSGKSKRIEFLKQGIDKEWFEMEYVTRMRPLSSIASELHIQPYTLQGILRYYGIKKRASNPGKVKIDNLVKKVPLASQISSLGITGHYDEVSAILVEMFPGRFASAADLARSLPGAVQKIGHAIFPFTLYGVKKYRERIGRLPTKVQYKLDELLVKISIEEYQSRFNQDPGRVMREIRKFAKETATNGMRPLTERVLEYYQSAYSFDIPGHGSLEDRH